MKMKYHPRPDGQRLDRYEVFNFGNEDCTNVDIHRIPEIIDINTIVTICYLWQR